MNTKIQSQKTKLPILGKRKAVTPPVIAPTTSSVEAILPLTVVHEPPRPSKGKEVAITPTIDTDGALETVRSKQALIEQDVWLFSFSFSFSVVYLDFVYFLF